MDDVFATSCGIVKAGPLFQSAVDDARLALKKRGAKRDAARKRLDDMERCAELLSRIYWSAGKTLDRTP